MRLLVVILLLAANFLCGCVDSAPIEHEEPEQTSLYKENSGLILPERIRRSIGLQLAEVTETNSVLVVPTTAVIEGAQDHFVYVENGEYLTRTPVKTGTIQHGHVEIISGLLTGDRVVSAAAKDLWMIELLALRGGNPCCPVPKKSSKG